MKSTILYGPLFGLMALGLAAPASADPSVPFPTYTVGLQPNGSYVVSDGQVITPAGIQVNLGSPVRAKAVAVNPIATQHTAAVLTMGASAPVQLFDTLTGEVLQTYLPFQDTTGTYGGITYSADGQYLFFSQDSSHLAIAKVGSDGLLSDYAHVAMAPSTADISCKVNPVNALCGHLYTPTTAYPGGVAVNAAGTTAYVLLNQNNTLDFVDLTQNPPVEGKQIRVGNAPNSIVVSGKYAYVSNEGGRVATATDFTDLSSGTPIVANKVNATATTGTVSVVDTTTQAVVANIPVGLHPTGMAVFGTTLLVSNTYSDTISVIDMTTNTVTRTISLAVPLSGKPYGAAPTGIAVDQATGTAYVALYNANAVAVVDLDGRSTTPVMGMIPVAFAPATVAFDKTHDQLLVSNDKGIGAQGSLGTAEGVTGYNTHQDTGTVNIIKLPTTAQLAKMTKQVTQNNHWDLAQNVAAASGGRSNTKPVAIPAHIGDPSLIKHVFMIIRENRSYDQMLGDVAAGNGDPSLAVFGGDVSPNAHALVKRFPLLDNFYDPSRQSADGHQWIIEAMAPYADDIQSPDWVRSYPGGNAGDALAYTQKGFLFQSATQAGLKVKLYGEYAETETWPKGEPSWSTLYADSQAFEAGTEKTLQYQTSEISTSSIPTVQNVLVANFPPFDLGIPDQWRVDWWLQDFNKDVAAGTVPALSIMWIMCDHTGGPPTVTAEQADNDLAVGRIIDYISHSSVWANSAIFVEEDDSQDGVDHVDGHRSPGYIVSPYAVQNQGADHTYYSQVNMTRTIEQILGLPTLNQYDLVASPMTTDFTNKPNFAPWSHVPNIIPLNTGVTASAAPLSPLAKEWELAKAEMFRGKLQKPDSEDTVTLNHYIWYSATNFTRPYPGEKDIKAPSAFASRMFKTPVDDDGDDD
jgi:YVTN family beta-propeller protein